MGSVGRGGVRLEYLVAIFVACCIVWALPSQFRPSPFERNAADAEFRLAMLRCALESYRADHGSWPRFDAERGAIVGLTEPTGVGSSPEGRGAGGPYLEQFPSNPFSQTAAVRVTDRTQVTVSDASEAGGWLYNPATGQVWLDSIPGVEW